MIFTESPLKGAFLIDPEKVEDSRGFFARTWCRREFERHGISFQPVQCNVSFNKIKGVLRGMHYQSAPHQEAKLIWCIKGAIHDVIIDLRPYSSTFTKHVAVVLSEENRRMLYIPEGFAHGFQTLQNESEIFYQMSEFYAPEFAKGVRWNDPSFGIQWPTDDRIISGRDQSYPDFNLTKD
ncbi:dTDP-4-dehydrorhamnose 3,5-epimerase [Candidatus Nitrospira allomarina]|jgi:dTDP-4-dehydrorhamnose 3,5-epimerase|uniref:dTDP-4-dehydrorhamnose 3,5-epimerase n=1 Tax=Candidatus Nitrospira allomarina TaxID=3020900 RepID=A0AA96GAU9_9BACT|nr:dTDP-4-dehydrorhamnose 3,5-epimerase [Candidatus Nitrospira allomarina]WNM58146.1 dTDP-4-dehydrorhamnose 3,5-epimerase [Candidatus Nitrospira allomarina]